MRETVVDLVLGITFHHCAATGYQSWYVPADGNLILDEFRTLEVASTLEAPPRTTSISDSLCAGGGADSTSADAIAVVAARTPIPLNPQSAPDPQSDRQVEEERQ